MSNVSPTELQNRLIKTAFNMLLNNLTGCKDSMNIQGRSDEQYKLIFINAICKSCVGDIENLYKSFLELLNIENINRDLKNYVQYDDELQLLKNKIEESKNEHDQKASELQKAQIMCDVIRNYLHQVNEEYSELTKDSQFKEIYQLESKTKKKFDKAERVNQMIIHDLIYMIDKLNREITMKTQAKT